MYLWGCVRGCCSHFVGVVPFPVAKGFIAYYAFGGFADGV